jgi:hypothetical protein
MKALPFILVLILAIGLAGKSEPVSAQAYGATFTTTIVYQNPTTGPATGIQVIFYASPATKDPVTIPRPDLPGGKTTSLFIGTLDQASLGFHGVTYLQSNPHLVAIQLQTPNPNSPVKAHPITNLPLYGSPMVWIGSVLRNQFGANTIIQVQNIDSQTNIVHLNLYNIKASLVHSSTLTLEPGEAFTFDAGAVQNNPLPEKFNGSALLTATRLDRKTPGKIIGTALELDNQYLGARSFEGIAHGATEVYMPSAACNFDIGGGVLLNTAYAVQNASQTSPTHVTITYSNGITQTQTVRPGAKASFVACQAAPMPSYFLGSAVLQSDTAPILVIGKAYGGGISTAFTGTSAGAGVRNLALPYVRWTNEDNWYNGAQERTFIAIQNVGTEIIHGKLEAYFYPCHGNPVAYEIPLGADGLAPGAKIGLKPSDASIDQFGACPKGPQVGGSVIISGPENSHLAAVVRVQQWDPAHGIVVGEDYNAINAP